MSLTSCTPPERETVVNATDADELTRITIPAGQWNPASGAKRRTRPMTEAERAAAAERLREARA